MSSTTSSTSGIPVPTQGTLSDLDSADHIHLALAQVLPSSSSSAQNSSGFAKLHAYARHAAERGADVVAFPEYFLTGATHQEWFGVRDSGGPAPFVEERSDEEESKEREEEEEKHWVTDICALAKELDINIVAGTVVELGTHHAPRTSASTKNSLYNTAYFIGREGTVQGRYTKRVRR